jgi:hypothetical protein
MQTFMIILQDQVAQKGIELGQGEALFKLEDLKPGSAQRNI